MHSSFRQVRRSWGPRCLGLVRDDIKQHDVRGGARVFGLGPTVTYHEPVSLSPRLCLCLSPKVEYEYPLTACRPTSCMHMYIRHHRHDSPRSHCHSHNNRTAPPRSLPRLRTILCCLCCRCRRYCCCLPALSYLISCAAPSCPGLSSSSFSAASPAPRATSPSWSRSSSWRGNKKNDDRGELLYSPQQGSRLDFGRANQTPPRRTRESVLNETSCCAIPSS